MNRLDNPNFRYYFLQALERGVKRAVDVQIDAAFRSGDVSPAKLKAETQLSLGAAVQGALNEVSRIRFPGD